MNKPNIIVAGILNTKGESVRYIAERVKAAGGNPQIMELSLGKECGWADIPLRKVLEPVGVTPEDIFSMDRAGACKLVTEGATDTILRLYREGRVHGIISTGGSMGTTIACTMMRALPIGIPKIMLSTEASGDVSMHVGTRDICMLYPIAETGLNKITRKILNYAASGIVGMASAPDTEKVKDRPLVGCMMFGVTTPCVLRAQKHMEMEGYEVLINHCTGAGGRSMEEMLEEGYISGMLDLTTEEVTADVFDTKYQRSGPARLRTAAKKGIPQVISVGGSELMLFEGISDIPDDLKKEIQDGVRGLYDHNPSVACVAITAEETRKLATEFCKRLACAVAPTVICIPMRGWGGCDIASPDLELGWAGEGPGPTWIPGENPIHSRRSEIMLEVLKKELPRKNNIEVLAIDKHINEEEFSDVASELLTEMLNGTWKRGSHTNLSYVESLF
ncbi:MAG: Tm-1-like ATP-binding domain-containing protein [Lachnospiraceae bacterium]|nr:Tm-1-like ATP-binding domain-containing protein [Lachnospiraceae bacterium]